MKTILLRVERVLSVVARVALLLAAAGLVLMTGAVAYAVFGRYVLNRTPNWAEALPIMIMAWFIFLGAAVGVREKAHLGFDVLLYVLPAGAKKVLRTVSDLVVLGFGIGMVVYGGQLAGMTWQNRTPTLGVPGGMAYLPVICGGVLIAVFTAERLLARFAGLPVDEDVPDAALAPQRERDPV